VESEKNVLVEWKVYKKLRIVDFQKGRERRMVYCDASTTNMLGEERKNTQDACICFIICGDAYSISPGIRIALVSVSSIIFKKR
jgi:hypothetical protein